MDRYGIPQRELGVVGLLVVTSSGECWKAPLLGTYGDGVTGTMVLLYYTSIDIYSACKCH